MDVLALGPLEVVDADGAVQAPGGRLHRAVLAVLAAAHPRAARLDTLVDALWGEDPPASARHTVQTHVSRLRRTTGLPVVAVDGGYRLDLPADRVDVTRFEDLLRSAADQPDASAARTIASALDLWRGPPFGGSADLPGVRERAGAVSELHDQALERRCRALVGAGLAEEAVVCAESLVASSPSRESAWVRLVDALVAAGRPADALAAFARGTGALDELGLLPSAELRTAQQRAFDAGAEPPRPAQGPGPAGPPERGDLTALPMTLSSFVGRAEDERAIEAVLVRGSVVTLVGAGGVGKTRLAVRVAQHLAEKYPAGVRFVDLAAVSRGSDVAGATLGALRVATEGGPADQALRRAADLDALVVVDNCEHLLDDVARTLPSLLGGRATVLATSRERLGLPGERVHPVGPLPTAGHDSPARRLFVERASAGGAVDDLDAVPPALLDAVVQALDGLPLAIEMAAARSSVVSVRELADLLRDPGADGLAAITHPDRGAAARHRTLQDVVAWSEALLEPEERRALSDWPVLAGQVCAEDAAAVLGTSRTVVERLAARSLLRASVDPSTGRTSYRLPHTVRGILVARPGAPPLRHREHLDHVLDAARQAELRSRTADEVGSVRRLDAVLDELRTAHAWARRNDPSSAAELSTLLHSYASATIEDEVFDWATQLGALHPSPAADVAHAARLAFGGRPAESAVRAAEALGEASDPRVAAQALELLADAALYEGRLDDCVAHAAALTELARDRRDVLHLALGATDHALALGYAGDPGGAAVLRDAARLVEQLGPCPSALGWLAYAEGELDAGPDLVALERAIDLADRVGNRYLGGVARVTLATRQARGGDPESARQGLAHAVRWWLDRADRSHLVTTLRNLVDVLVRVEADRAAAELYGTVGDPDRWHTYGAEADLLARAGETLEARLGPDLFAELVARGRTRDVPEAARAALAHG